MGTFEKTERLYLRLCFQAVRLLKNPGLRQAGGKMCNIFTYLNQVERAEVSPKRACARSKRLCSLKTKSVAILEKAG